MCGEEEGEVLSGVFTRAAQLLADLLPPQAVDFAQGMHQIKCMQSIDRM